MSDIARPGLRVSWRAVEWWGAGVSLFLQTGAIFPLLMADADGTLSDPAKSKLRLLSLPIYGYTILILLRHRQQFLIAARRNLHFLLLLAMPLLSVLWSVAPSISLRRAIGFVLTVLFAYALAIRFTPRQLLLLVMLTSGVCTVASLLMLGVSPRLARMPTDGTLRGIFLHKNSLGWYASITVVTAFIVLLDQEAGYRRTAVALLLAGLAGLAGSTSMTAILSTGTAFLAIRVYTILPRLRGLARVAFILLVLELGAVLLLGLSAYLVRFLEAIGKDATLTGRVPLWALVDEQISRHLLLGFGYQAFWTEANGRAWAIWSSIGWMAPHSHNGFREILLGFGVGGLIIFTLVMVRSFRLGAALHCAAPSEGWLWTNVLLVMVLVMNLTESTLLVQNDAIFTIFMAAVIMCSLHAPNRDLVRRPRSATPAIGWGSILPRRRARIMRPPVLPILLGVLLLGAGGLAEARAEGAASVEDAGPSGPSQCGVVPRASDTPLRPVPRLGDPSPASPVFYVSPRGDDRWSGLKPDPAADLSDGPLASIEAARDAVRATGSPGRIIVGGGDYYLTRPILFDDRDSGLEIQGEAGTMPVLHGGVLVEGWLPEADGRWSASIPAGTEVAALFIDGASQPLARYPDKPSSGDRRDGWLFADAPAPDSDPWQGNTQFRYRDGDLPELQAIDGLVTTIMGGFNPGSQWGSDTMPVTAIDVDTRTIQMKGTGYFFTGEGSRYYLSGLEAFQDAPGEWLADAAEGRIWLVPTDTEPDAARIVAGVLPTLIHLDGADGMAIAGLALRDGSPVGTGKFGTDTRGGGAIRVERSNGVRLLGNFIGNIGVGIHVTESRHVEIAGNEIGPVAGNGVYLGTTYGSFGRSDDAHITSNHIHDVGEVYFESAGIFFQAADDVSVSGNLVENAAQFGIAGGSIWGQEDAVHRAVIADNEIRNANLQTADGGAIKMMGSQADLQRIIIRSNRITGTRALMNHADGTFWPTDYENVEEWPSPVSWAIYTDGKASGITIEDNVLIDNVSAIGINGGWSNLVTGNVIVGGSGAAFRIDDGTGRDWRPDWAEPNRIEGNTVSIGSRSTLAASVYEPGNGHGYVRFAGNRYCGDLGERSFDIRPEIMASGRFGSLQALQAAGMDVGSVGPPPQRRFRLFGGPR